MEFGRLVTEIERLGDTDRKRGYKEIGMAKANHIVKTAVGLYRAGGRKNVEKGLRNSIGTMKGGRVWITPDQSRRGCQIVITLINKSRWWLISRSGRMMRANMKRLTK